MEKKYLIKVKKASDEGCWYAENVGNIYLVKDYRLDPDIYFIKLDSNFGFYKKDVEVITEFSVDDKLFVV